MNDKNLADETKKHTYLLRAHENDNKNLSLT